MASSEHFRKKTDGEQRALRVLLEFTASRNLSFITRINEISNNQAHVNENASMRAVAKILRARASEHSCNFCEQFEQRPNFGTIQYPCLAVPKAMAS